MSSRNERIFYGQSLRIATRIKVAQYQESTNVDPESQKFIEEIFDLAEDIVKTGYQRNFTQWSQNKFLSKEEIEEYKENVEEMEVEDKPPEEKPPTDKQIDYIKSLLEDLGKDWEEVKDAYSGMNRQQASNLIDELKQKT